MNLDVKCEFHLHATVVLPDHVDVSTLTDEMISGLQQDFNKGLIDLLVDEFDKESDLIELHSVGGSTLIKRIEES